MMIDQLYAKTIDYPKAGIIYLYCDYRDQVNQNIINIIGSLTNQLLALLNKEVFDAIYDQLQIEGKVKQYQTLQSIMTILHLVCKMFDQVFICLDAIDELETETQTAFMKSFQEIISRTGSGKIFLFFTARPHVKDIVTQALGHHLRSVTVMAHDDDIQKYILHQLDIDPYRKLMNDDLRDQLLIKVPQNSRGM